MGFLTVSLRRTSVKNESSLSRSVLYSYWYNNSATCVKRFFSLGSVLKIPAYCCRIYYIDMKLNICAVKYAVSPGCYTHYAFSVFSRLWRNSLFYLWNSSRSSSFCLMVLSYDCTASSVKAKSSSGSYWRGLSSENRTVCSYDCARLLFKPDSWTDIPSFFRLNAWFSFSKNVTCASNWATFNFRSRCVSYNSWSNCASASRSFSAVRFAIWIFYRDISSLNYLIERLC